ncbi:prepilin-type N-terminal cleavage/methylation domain-containing protein [Candidatus Parcubacteria bacterium]|nr:prepilin-type N-terminal cleavage/methylation domain-containing protein [Candidatus Parcubacteria bacterium]
MFNNTKNTKGFTLTEILVTLGIFSVLAVGATSLLRDSFIFKGIAQTGLNSIDEGRKILRPLVGEVRSASQSHNGAYVIENASAETFIFYSDIDNDDLIERVRYFLDEDTLKKGVTEPSGSPLSYDLNNEEISWVIQDVANGASPVFEYFDTNYDGTTDPLVQPVSSGDVRLVKITIIIDHDPNRPPEAVELSTQMTIRNLKDNL